MGTRKEHEAPVLPKPAEDDTKDKYIAAVANRLRSKPPPPLDVRRQLKLQEKNKPKAKAKAKVKAKAKAKAKPKAKAAASTSAELKKAAKESSEHASAGSTTGSAVRLSSRASKLEEDLEALKAIEALCVENVLGEGKMSCTILVALDGRIGVQRSEAFFRVNVNLAKRSYWIYGGEDALGFTFPKRNFRWATTSPAEAWQSVLDAMQPCFTSEPPEPKKAKKGKK